MAVNGTRGSGETFPAVSLNLLLCLSQHQLKSYPVMQKKKRFFNSNSHIRCCCAVIVAFWWDDPAFLLSSHSLCVFGCSGPLASCWWQNGSARCSEPISQSRGNASSYWAQWGVREYDTSPLTRTAPLHGPPVGMVQGDGPVWLWAPRGVTSEWACQFRLKGPVVMKASEVKQGASAFNGCFKTVLKCVCIIESVSSASSGWAGQGSMTHIHIDTCHWSYEA